jgi:hypothetical protein
MPFDTKKFLKTKFQPRTEEVPVKNLADFFAPGEKPVWIVRGLTGQELGRANEAVEKNKNVAAILDALIGSTSQEKADAIKSAIGLDAGQTPADVVKRLDHLVMGSVAPVCTQEMAVRVCEAYPIEFFMLTNAILKLSGQGQTAGKQKPSGATTESEQASSSEAPEGSTSTS